MQQGEQSGVEIGTTGLGKEPEGDLSLRRLAVAVLSAAMTDLMDGEENENATQFFYSTDMNLWCGILKLEAGCVRENLENLGLLQSSVSMVPGITSDDMMRHYIDISEQSEESNLEILLDMAYQLKIPYAVVHFYIYEQILKWKPIHIRYDLGKEFFKAWNKHTKTKKGRGSSSRFGLIIKEFRKKLAEGNCDS